MLVAGAHELREPARGDLADGGVRAELVLQSDQRERIHTVARGREIPFGEEAGDRRVQPLTGDDGQPRGPGFRVCGDLDRAPSQ